jgi:2-dehydropantoate 2-reductase
MQILVVGAGAVGGYFGGRLLQANRDVTFLVRAKRAEEMNKHGLQILSPHGNVKLQPKLISASQLSKPFDLLLLGVKSYALSDAMNDFASAVGPDTMILPVLNGMRHIDLLVERFGERAVLGGVCVVAAEIDEAGRIKQLADFQSLTYGELDGQTTARLHNVDGTLRGAGFDAAMSSHIMADMWQKWVQLAALGAINCLLRGDLGQITAIPGGAALSLELLSECSAIAAACGYPQTEAFLERQRAQLTVPNSRMTSSMYRDLTRGAPVEVATILGDLLEHGQKRGLATPLLQAAFVNLSIYQHARDRSTMSASQ